MSIALSILASGSSGNCAALRTPLGVTLIDCGIGPRTSEKRLKPMGVSLADIREICLTHLDRDHFQPSWTSTIIRSGIRLRCSYQNVNRLLMIAGMAELARLIDPFDTAPQSLRTGVAMRAIALAHDASGSHGFHFEGFDCQLGYATDLGHVPAELRQCFGEVDVLAMESNYDPHLQRTSGRPEFLQRRITGGSGHLSNQQAMEAIQAILDQRQSDGWALPRHIVLLHRSQQCNCPKLVREMFSRDVRIAPRLTLAEQYFATPWLDAKPLSPAVGAQLMLGWG